MRRCYQVSFDDYTMGCRFTAQEDASVVALGVWDYAGDGLAENHDVSLWTDDGSALLASITVYAGRAAYLSEGFRWRDLTTAVALEAGKTYRAGAHFDSTNSDLVAYSEYTSISVDSRISHDGWASVTAANGELRFTDNVGVGGESASYFLGGNVRWGGAVSAVPEPTSVGLLALGLTGLAFARVRRRVRAKPRLSTGCAR